MNFTFWNYDVTISFTSRRPRHYFKWNKYKHEQIWHLVWWKLSIVIEDWTSEHYAICAQCEDSDIGEASYGDESWTICKSCQSVEQGYKYINKRQYEELFL